MIPPYSSIYNLGHKYVVDLLKTPVIVEEKIDGSAFYFRVVLDSYNNRTVQCRSKSKELNIDAPEKLFIQAVESVLTVKNSLTPGYIYRAEYLSRPKHNVLNYDRIPKNNLIIYDIDTADQCYLSPQEKAIEANRIGLECVPVLFEGLVSDVDQLKQLLEHTSCLGGTKIEGVVIKNYEMFGVDKKVLMGKYVSEAFKEVHRREWKENNPSKNDILQNLITKYKTPARWQKAIIHLEERDLIKNCLTDIGLLIKEIPLDILKECEDEIRDELFKWAWPKIQKACVSGFADYYKQLLLKKQFETDEKSPI